MAENLSSSAQRSSQRIPIRERAFPVGNVVGVNGYRANRTLLRQRLVEGGYQVYETPHFIVGCRSGSPSLVVHWFAPEAINADLGRYFLEELKPIGLLAQPQGFGDVFGAVVGSLFPRDPLHAWHLFGVNTLEHYHRLLAANAVAPDHDSPLDVFATLYRRVCPLVAGESLLDAGCSSGFFPLVVAERAPSLQCVIGVDIRPEPFSVASSIADERNLGSVTFKQADLLADDFPSIGSFDTVTALHVLEHFTEEAMYRVLANLLRVAQKRLILAVPFEASEPETVYGHQQVFSRARLEAVGQWCLDQWKAGQMHYEDCAGGLVYLNCY